MTPCDKKSKHGMFACDAGLGHVGPCHAYYTSRDINNRDVVQEVYWTAEPFTWEQYRLDNAYLHVMFPGRY